MKLIDRGFRHLVRTSPSLVKFGARQTGAFLFRRGTARRRDLLLNLEAAFPGEDVEAIAKKVVRARYEMMIEQLELDYVPPAELRAFVEQRISWRGLEHFDAALDGPEAVILYTPHYGHFAIACLSLVLRAVPKKTVGMFFNPPEKNPYAPRMRRLIENLGLPAQALYNDRGGLLKAFRILQKGGVIGLMPDVYDYEAGTIFVPFFGRFTHAMPGSAFLAQKYNARLLPLYCHRVARGRYEIAFDAPLPLATGGDLEGNVWQTTAAIHANMEAHLRAAPEEWMYWDAFLRRIYPGVTVPRDRAEWDLTLAALSRRFWRGSGLAEIVGDLQKVQP
jgi:KDO2-lipid IV(A) lauroyltransferase